MSLYNTTNVKNLPQIDQIISTDYLIVENYSGTNKLLFKDFVVGTTNTSFYTFLNTNLNTLSSTTVDQDLRIKSLSASGDDIISNLTNLQTKVDNIDSTVSSNKTLAKDSIDLLTSNLSLTSNNLTIDLNNVKSQIDEINDTYPITFNGLVLFRWNSTAYGAVNYRATTQLFTALTPFELSENDILFVRPKYSNFRIGYNYTGTLSFRLSTLFFNGSLGQSTYMLLLSSSTDVPKEITNEYDLPGTTTKDTSPTFLCRFMTTENLMRFTLAS